MMAHLGMQTTAIDIWSVGCVLAELLGSRPFFKGRDYVDQLNQILHYLGTPTEETIQRIGSSLAQDYVRSLPHKDPVPMKKVFPDADPVALNLLEQLLCFDPTKRISCEGALGHSYLEVWNDPDDQKECETVCADIHAGTNNSDSFYRSVTSASRWKTQSRA
jgi:serine/threonine protein kinase